MSSTEKPPTKRPQKHKGRSGGHPGTIEEMAQIDAERRQELKKKIAQMQERLMFLLEFEWAPEQYKYRYLESRTGIPASNWQNFFLGRQQATVEMIVAVCSHMPLYVGWLMTGFPGTDSLGNRLPREGTFEKYLQHREWVKEQKLAR